MLDRVWRMSSLRVFLVIEDMWTTCQSQCTPQNQQQSLSKHLMMSTHTWLLPWSLKKRALSYSTAQLLEPMKTAKLLKTNLQALYYVFRDASTTREDW